jgi:transcriptional regulator with XRE-family HTH domain
MPMARLKDKSKIPQHPTFFKQWRKYRSYTLEQAAEISGMSIGNISAMERGAQGYSQAGLEALANAYNCSPGQLLMVDPTNNDIWSIWEKAKTGDRQKIVEIAKIITGGYVAMEQPEAIVRLSRTPYRKCPSNSTLPNPKHG